MCFYTDYDWTASVYEITESDAGFPTRCDECGKPLTMLDWRRRIWMQEAEECRICEDEFSEKYIDNEDIEDALENGDAEYAAEMLKALDEHQHDYGETCLYHRCSDCDKILQAVEAREKAEGCPVHERLPALGEMQESLAEHEQAAEYATHAIGMFPELAGNTFLQELLTVSEE